MTIVEIHSFYVATLVVDYQTVSKFTFIIMNKEYVTLHNYYMAEAKEESRVTQYIELNEAQCGQEGIGDVAMRNSDEKSPQKI